MYALCTITCHPNRRCLISRRVTSSRLLTKTIWRKVGCMASSTIMAGTFLMSLSRTFKRYSIDLMFEWSCFFFLIFHSRRPCLHSEFFSLSATDRKRS